MRMYPEEFDSVFRYIIVVSQRAEQLIMGAKPRMESRHTKPTMIAKDEVDSGLISWRILTPEEIEAQRHALVEQYRSEVGAETAEGQAHPIPDVLPTAPAEETATQLEEPGDGDKEVARLSQLLGFAEAASEAEAEDKAGDESEDEAEPSDEPSGEPDGALAGDLSGES